MDHRVGVVDEFREQVLIFDIVEVILHPVEGFEMADVLHAAGGKIVEQHDLIAAIKQALRKMRADEAGAASNQESQKASTEQYVM